MNDALRLGPSGPMRGKQLEALGRQVAPAVVADLLDAAKTKVGRLKQLARIADGLESANALLGAAPIDVDSIVIDSNARIAVDELVRGIGKEGKKIERFADLDPNYRDAINAIRQARGLDPYVDPPTGSRPTVDSIVGRGADLRTTQIPGAEAMVNETSTNRSPTLATMKGVGTNRTHPDYPAVLDELKHASIGTSKGAADRSLVIDAMFADDTAGGVPKLATADRDLCLALAKNFVTSPRTFAPTGDRGVPHWTQLLSRFPEGHFTIEIRGHKLEVYFHERTNASPYPP